MHLSPVSGRRMPPRVEITAEAGLANEFGKCFRPLARSTVVAVGWFTAESKPAKSLVEQVASRQFGNRTVVGPHVRNRRVRIVVAVSTTNCDHRNLLVGNCPSYAAVIKIGDDSIPRPRREVWQTANRVLLDIERPIALRMLDERRHATDNTAIVRPAGIDNQRNLLPQSHPPGIFKIEMGSRPLMLTNGRCPRRRRVQRIDQAMHQEDRSARDSTRQDACRFISYLRTCSSHHKNTSKENSTQICKISQMIDWYTDWPYADCHRSIDDAARSPWVAEDWFVTQVRSWLFYTSP